MAARCPRLRPEKCHSFSNSRCQEVAKAEPALSGELLQAFGCEEATVSSSYTKSREKQMAGSSLEGPAVMPHCGKSEQRAEQQCIAKMAETDCFQDRRSNVSAGLLDEQLRHVETTECSRLNSQTRDLCLRTGLLSTWTMSNAEMYLGKHPTYSESNSLDNFMDANFSLQIGTQPPDQRQSDQTLGLARLKFLDHFIFVVIFVSYCLSYFSVAVIKHHVQK
ncbi:hypothetical protein STEG23_000906 [Scotinomys teguina]